MRTRRAVAVYHNRHVIPLVVYRTHVLIFAELRQNGSKQAGGALRVQRGRWMDSMLKLTQLLLAATALLALALFAYEILLG